MSGPFRLNRRPEFPARIRKLELFSRTLWRIWSAALCPPLLFFLWSAALYRRFCFSFGVRRFTAAFVFPSERNAKNQSGGQSAALQIKFRLEVLFWPIHDNGYP